MSKNYSILSITFQFVILIFITTPLFSEYNWEKFGNLNRARLATEVQPLNNHQIIVIGGLDSSGNGMKECEIIDIDKKTINYSSSMNFPHGYCSSAMNSDSVIVVSGGHFIIWENSTNAVEKYDKKNDKWILLGTLKLQRAEHTSIFVNDSILLVVGGEYQNSMATDKCELFNINTGISKFTIYNLPISMSTPCLQKLSNGEIILLSGRNGRENANRSKYIYKFDLSNENWVLYDSLRQAVSNPHSVNTSDGKLVTFGGVIQENPLRSSDLIYLENIKNKIELKNRLFFNRSWSSITNLDENNVIISGGYDDQTIPIAESEIFNLNTYSVTLGPSNISPRRHHKTITMTTNDGYRIFAIGGGAGVFQPTNVVEEIKPVKIKSPDITEKLKSCEEYSIAVEDASGISDLKLIDSLTNNISIVSMQFSGLNRAKIKLKVIEKNKTGKFSIIVTNFYGKITILSDSITQNGYDIISDYRNFTLNFNAYPTKDTIVLTSNNYNYRGSIWMNEKVNLDSPFNLYFSFQYINGKNEDCDDGSENGADGIAFVIQNTNLNACGMYGGYIGYGGMKNAIAFEFDTFANDSNQIIDLFDPNGNHFAIQHSKDEISPMHNQENTLFFEKNIPKMHNNLVYNINIEYQGKNLKIFMDSAGKNNRLIANLDNFDFKNYITTTDNSAYFGFTSATGCAVAEHRIFNWSICNTRNVLGIEDASQSSTPLISPNPASDYIEISTPFFKGGQGVSPLSPAGGGRGWTVEIHNVFGESLSTTPPFGHPFELEGEKIKIDISNLPAGVYFIKIGNKFEKFIKM